MEEWCHGCKLTLLVVHAQCSLDLLSDGVHDGRVVERSISLQLGLVTWEERHVSRRRQVGQEVVVYLGMFAAAQWMESCRCREDVQG